MGQGANFCGQGAAPFKNSQAGALISNILRFMMIILMIIVAK